MANLVITTTTNSVNIEMNDAAEKVGFLRGVWRKNQLNFVENEGMIMVFVTSQPSFTICGGLPVDGALLIDSIDGVTITDNDHLYSLLSALIA